MNDEATLRKIVGDVFASWVNGGSDFLDILDDNVLWTIVGSGPSARTLAGRDAFREEAYGPIAATFATPMEPRVIAIHADGPTVIVRWDGIAAMKDGQTYRNSYAWFLEFAGGKVVRVEAFLDLPTYDVALDGRTLPPWPEPQVLSPSMASETSS